MGKYFQEFKASLDLDLVSEAPRNCLNFLDSDSLFEANLILDEIRSLLKNWKSFDGGYREVFISDNYDFVVKLPLEACKQMLSCQLLEYMRANDPRTAKTLEPLNLSLPKTELVVFKNLPIVLMEKINIKDVYPFLDLKTSDLSLDEDTLICFLESKFKSFCSGSSAPLEIQEFEILKEISVQYGFNSLEQRVLYDLGGYGEFIEFSLLKDNSFYQDVLPKTLKKNSEALASNFSADKIKLFEYF